MNISANQDPLLLLKDHFPSFFDQLTDALSGTIERVPARVLKDRELAIEFIEKHRKSRATLLFTLAETIRELQILRECTLAVLEEEMPIPLPDRYTISKIFDEVVVDAATNLAEFKRNNYEHLKWQLRMIYVHPSQSPRCVRTC